MGLTERLARGAAARPRTTLLFWGVGVLIALVLVATSLHGLSSQSHVVGKPAATWLGLVVLLNELIWQEAQAGDTLV